MQTHDIASAYGARLEIYAESLTPAMNIDRSHENLGLEDWREQEPCTKREVR